VKKKSKHSAATTAETAPPHLPPTIAAASTESTSTSAAFVEKSSPRNATRIPDTASGARTAVVPATVAERCSDAATPRMVMAPSF
jgi:hypothetical protein